MKLVPRLPMKESPAESFLPTALASDPVKERVAVNPASTIRFVCAVTNESAAVNDLPGRRDNAPENDRVAAKARANSFETARLPTKDNVAVNPASICFLVRLPTKESVAANPLSMIFLFNPPANESVGVKAFPVPREIAPTKDRVAVKARLNNFDDARFPTKESVAVNPALRTAFMIAPTNESVGLKTLVGRLDNAAVKESVAVSVTGVAPLVAVKLLVTAQSPHELLPAGSLPLTRQ